MPHDIAGGRLWNKRWGLPKLTKGQKENRRKQQALIRDNRSILRMAARLQPEQPVVLERALPPWQLQRMRSKLEAPLEQVGARLQFRPHALAAARLIAIDLTVFSR